MSSHQAYFPPVIAHSRIRASQPISAALAASTGQDNLFIRPLSAAEAHHKVAAYLHCSQLDGAAHFHPDSVMAPAGAAGAGASSVRFSATSGREGGLVIHYLRRIEQALAGNDLGGPPEFKTEEEMLAASVDPARPGQADDKDLTWIDPAQFANEEEEAGREQQPGV